jgi:hypothetical protein
MPLYERGLSANKGDGIITIGVDILVPYTELPVLYILPSVMSMFDFSEEMGDLRRQLKILEDKNTSYMQQTMELEEVSGVVCFSLSLNGCIFSATQS